MPIQTHPENGRCVYVDTSKSNKNMPKFLAAPTSGRSMQPPWHVVSYYIICAIVLP